MFEPCDRAHPRRDRGALGCTGDAVLRIEVLDRGAPRWSPDSRTASGAAGATVAMELARRDRAALGTVALPLSARTAGSPLPVPLTGEPTGPAASHLGR